MEENRYIKQEYRDFTRKKSFVITLTLVGYEVREVYPYVKIWVNKKLYHESFVKGEDNITFELKEVQKRNVLKIEMTNKKNNDTILENGKIVKDKKVEIKKILLDGVNVRNKFLGRQKPNYHYKQQGPTSVTSNWLFFSGKWRYYFENPPIQYFSKMQLEKALWGNTGFYTELIKKLKKHQTKYK